VANSWTGETIADLLKKKQLLLLARLSLILKMGELI
jgi:hypothetical protein